MKRSVPIKRKKPMKRVSAKRQKEGRIYSAKRNKFLVENPLCEFQTDGWKCRSWAEDVHHKQKRGKFYLDESTWMSVCRFHHDIIHHFPEFARKLGYLT